MNRRPLLLLSVVATVAACANSMPAKSTPKGRAPRVVVGRKAGGGPPPPHVRRFAASRDGSAVLLAEVDDRVLAYVADEDDRLVRVVDVDDEREIGTLAPGERDSASIPRRGRSR
jgi:hypothetical protein